MLVLELEALLDSSSALFPSWEVSLTAIESLNVVCSCVLMFVAGLLSGHEWRDTTRLLDYDTCQKSGRSRAGGTLLRSVARSPRGRLRCHEDIDDVTRGRAETDCRSIAASGEMVEELRVGRTRVAKEDIVELAPDERPVAPERRSSSFKHTRLSTFDVEFDE